MLLTSKLLMKKDFTSVQISMLLELIKNKEKSAFATYQIFRKISKKFIRLNYTIICLVNKGKFHIVITDTKLS